MTSTSSRADSGVLVFVLATAAFALASLCLASLAWDGSYFLVRTLQDGVAFMPAHRWFHWLMLEPVLWLKPLFNDPIKLSVIHGLMCSIPPLFSLAVCLAMLRGELSRLRIWVIFGILLVPVPGQFFLVTEVIPAIQLGWILFVFGWLGCPHRWAPVALIAMASMATLHPAAAPLFFCAALTCGAFSFLNPKNDRRRILAWTAAFTLTSVAKLVETMLFASAYERANMSGSIWITETVTAFLFSPFAAIVPILLDVGLYFWGLLRPDFRGRKPWLTKSLWGASFLLGIAYTMIPGGWACSINYRKFVLILTIPVALMAGLDAWRQKRHAVDSPGRLPSCGVALIYPASLFVVMMACLSFSWLSLCASLVNRLEANPGRVMTWNALPSPVADSALNHWSTTSLSMVLQGWHPGKVFLWNRDLQLPAIGFCICPGDGFLCEDKVFKLAWLGQLIDGGTRAQSSRLQAPKTGKTR